jgi:hypothetical protein
MAQIGMAEAEAALDYIRGRLKPSGHRVGVSDPLVSLIEGILSRGDERTAALVEEAWRAGCRLDAWQDEIKKDVWRKVLSEHGDLVDRILRGWEEAEALPWDLIKSGVGESYLSREHGRSRSCASTSPCIEKCTHPCGICDSGSAIMENHTQPGAVSGVEVGKADSLGYGSPVSQTRGADAGTRRLLFSFVKQGPAVFHAHLSVLEVFAMAFVRAEIPVCYSEGFNPLPRLEVVAPLSLGIASDAEMAAMDTTLAFDAVAFVDNLNRCLPRGFVVTRAEPYHIPQGHKKYSLSSLLWGFEYVLPDGSHALVPREKEKEFRAPLVTELSGDAGAPGRPTGVLYRLKRCAVLARDPQKTGDCPGESYFDVYRRLYQ